MPEGYEERVRAQAATEFGFVQSETAIDLGDLAASDLFLDGGIDPATGVPWGEVAPGENLEQSGAHDAQPQESTEFDESEDVDVCEEPGMECYQGRPIDPATNPGPDAVVSETPSVSPEPEQVDCEARPWARGCAGTEPDETDDPFAEDLGAQGDAGDDQDPSAGAEDEPEGVQVPQEIIDRLLTPGDNEPDAAQERPADSENSGDDAESGDDDTNGDTNEDGG